MQFIHINDNWNAEPNAPEVEIKVQNKNVIVSFYLNTFEFSDYNENDKGILTFVIVFNIGTEVLTMKDSH